MELPNLFEIQKGLKEHIGYNKKDRFSKLMLGLLVEIGECANEWRGFKFWSKDQKMRPAVLEEYVDGLHLILEVGLDLNFESRIVFGKFKMGQIEEQFLEIYLEVCNLRYAIESGFSIDEIFIHYKNLWMGYIGLGEMLGFTWEAIEHAYIQKNAVNHQRQESGY